MILLITRGVWLFVAEVRGALDFMFGSIAQRGYVQGAAGTYVSILSQVYFEIYPSPPLGSDLLPVGPRFFVGVRFAPAPAGHVYKNTQVAAVCQTNGAR